MQYAEADLQRSEKLFQNEDFGFAAYSAQQGLEKYLKSYILKSKLIKEVQKLRHLQYPEVIAETISIFEKQKNDEKEIAVIKVLNSAIEHFTILKKTFVKVEKSNDYKILFWKASMSLELNDNEKTMLNGIYLTNRRSAAKYLKTTMEYFASGTFSKNLENKKLPSEIKQQIPTLLLSYVQALAKGDHNIVEIREKIMTLLKPYFYGSGPKSLSKDESDVMIKLSLIEQSFDWYEYVLLSFPHQEVGRYPTMIDGVEATTQYEKNKENLWKLIQGIEVICKRIRTAIISSSEF